MASLDITRAQPFAVLDMLRVWSGTLPYTAQPPD